MALPAHQAVAVQPEQAASLDMVELWQGRAGDHTHTLQVRTASGLRALCGREPRLENLPFSSLYALSPLLREALREMPYIVGAAWVEERPTWLVDMSRFTAHGRPRIGPESARRDENGP